VGNRLTALNTALWSYNSSNQLTSRPSVSYTYDNNGNTLTKTDGTGTTNYSWDTENRLTTVTASGSTVSHLYDPFGRRIYKSSGFGTTIYLYDGANIVTELDQNGMAAASFAQGAGIDQPLAMLQSGNISYYHQDGLGSVTSLTGTGGTVSGSNIYDAFGNTAQFGLSNPFRYTGREFDSEDGLYYYRARYYDPTSGRFLNEDLTLPQFPHGDFTT
jgi:RHS repeat-associated protein